MGTFDPDASYDFTERDIVFARPDGIDLKVRLYEPVSRHPDPTPAVVDLHGGAWCIGHRSLGAPYHRSIAAAGAIVAAIDFRDGRNGRHPVATVDTLTAIRWLRANASALGIDPARIALTGNSSGGHLALTAALQPDHPAALGIDIDTPSGPQPSHSIDASVCLVAALWAPVDPLARYRYAQTKLGWPVPESNRLDAPALVSSTETYFGDESTMATASITHLVTAGHATAFPPVWLVRAGDDLNVPAELLPTLRDAYVAAGGTAELTDYSGEIHGFGHGDGPGADRFRRDLNVRLASAFAP